MKKSLSFLSAVLLILAALPLSVHAARDFTEAEVLAAGLKEQGLFLGTDKGYELFRAPTRAEALVMLLRSLGKEAEAKAYIGKNPFKDAEGHWAEKYISYAYDNCLTKGISGKEFGVKDSVSSAMYLTFVLRALGYSDKNNADFSWKDPYTLAKSAGLLPSSVDTDKFLRADAVIVSCASLSALMKDGSSTLADSLGLFEIPFKADSLSLTVSSADDLYLKLNWALSEFPEKIEIVPAGELKSLTVPQLLEMCVEYSATYCSYIGCSYFEGSNITTLAPEYSDAACAYALGSGWRNASDDKVKELLETAEAVIKELDIGSLDEEQAVKAIHDWIAGNAIYDGTLALTNSYSARGVLIDGTGVCDAYSYAFWLLCRLSGLDCIRVSGTCEGGSHAWNKVKIDGKWYNIDVTWDDPVYHLNGVLTDTIQYDYYLLSDEAIAADHVWTQFKYMPAAE